MADEVTAGSVILDEAVDDAMPPEAVEASYADEQTTSNVAVEPEVAPGQPVETVDAERYLNLERKLSEQGDEVGQLRQTTNQLQEQNRMLQEQAANFQQQAQIATSQNPAFETQVAEIAEKVESGDLSIAEGMKAQAAVAREQATMEAQTQASNMVNQKFKEVDEKNVANQFRQDNPDFDQVVTSGVLDQIKAQNPVHDNVSAYYAFKAGQAASNTETAAKEAYAKGVAEQSKLEAGKNVAANTLAQPGANAQPAKPSGPMNSTEVESSMLSRLQGMRSAG